MLELSPSRKNKIHLADYNCQEDIQNRIFMSDFTAIDVEILEELLYNPLKVSYKKLLRSVGCPESQFAASLAKFAQAGLLSTENDTILVDKEKRKYFEFQIARFDPEFKPDMEFIQGILRKVPIHVLPTWYSIPRTSNNIFESIVEKYLLTPQIFQRYLLELNFGDPVANAIVQDLFSSPDFKVSTSDLISKYNLTRRNFEEILLILEFNFVCCLTYEKEDDHWLEFIIPFHEWNEYLRFLKSTEAPLISPSTPIQRTRSEDFAFVKDMAVLLQAAKKQPVPLAEDGSPSISQEAAARFAAACSFPAKTEKEAASAHRYFLQIAEKMALVKLADKSKGFLRPSEGARDWLDMSCEERALYLYRHPMNRLTVPAANWVVAPEKLVREAEKSIKRALHGKWVYFDDFLKGVTVPLNEESVIALKRTGKQWKYALPLYGDFEKALLKATLFEWLFETGMTTVGSCQGRDCFAVTPFGRFFFED